MMNVFLEKLSDVLDIISDFFGEEVSLLMIFCLSSVKLNDV